MKEKIQIEKHETEMDPIKAKGYSLAFKFGAIILIISSIIIPNLDYIISNYKLLQADKKTPHIEGLDTDEHKKEHSTIIHDLGPVGSIEEEVEREKLEEMGVKDAEFYRSYITSVGRLVSKFYANIDYEKELSYLRSSKLEYPQKVTAALDGLMSHREKYLTHKSEQYKQVTLEGNFVKRLVNKMINIRQENPLYQAMEEDHKNLRNELSIIEEYFYSEEFLKYCLNYD